MFPNLASKIASSSSTASSTAITKLTSSNNSGTTTVNVYASRFSSNFAESGSGNDVKNSASITSYGASNSMTFLNTCPSPYFPNVPDRGKTRINNNIYFSSSHRPLAHLTAIHLSTLSLSGKSVDIETGVEIVDSSTHFSFSECNYFTCDAGDYNPTRGDSISSCAPCQAGTTSTRGSASCLISIQTVGDMDR